MLTAVRQRRIAEAMTENCVSGANSTNSMERELICVVMKVYRAFMHFMRGEIQLHCVSYGKQQSNRKLYAAWKIRLGTYMSIPQHGFYGSSTLIFSPALAATLARGYVQEKL